MTHLTQDDLSALLDGALTGTRRGDAERHLAACEPCRDALAMAAGRDALIQRALVHDPGEAYFVTFADRVTQRLREDAPARREVVAGGGWRAWFTPRRLAWVGTAASIAIVAGIVMLQPHEAGMPFPRPGASSATTPTAPETEGRARVEAQAPRRKAMSAPPANAPPRPVFEGARDRVSMMKTNSRHEPPRPANPSAMSAPAPTATDQRATAVAPAAPEEAAPPPAVAGDAAVRRESGMTSQRAVPSQRMPGGEEGPAPASGLVSRTAPAPSTGAKLLSGIQALRERFVRPLDKSSGTAGATQGFAPAPSEGARPTAQLEAAPRADEVAPASEWSVAARPIATLAETLTVRGERAGSPQELDRASAAWTRVARAVPARSAMEVQARARAADAAVLAWKLDPTASRRSKALGAVERVLDIAPDYARYRELRDRLR